MAVTNAANTGNLVIGQSGGLGLVTVTNLGTVLANQITLGGGTLRIDSGGTGIGATVGNGAQHAQELPPAARHAVGSSPFPGSADAAAVGLSGRISQRGRRVPSGETWPAGRVCAIHCS